MSLPPVTPPPPSPKPTPPPPPGPGRLYSVAALAQEWECSDQHIYNLIAAGQLAPCDIAVRGKAKTRISAAEVQRYIATHTRRTPKGRAA